MHFHAVCIDFAIVRTYPGFARSISAPPAHINASHKGKWRQPDFTDT
jgi:hypothetical protein